MSLDLEKIRKLIQSGDNASAIKKLVALPFPSENLNNEAIAFSSRHHNVYKKYNAGHIDFGDFTMENAKITSGLLLLLTAIENYKPTPQNDIQKSRKKRLDAKTIINTIAIKNGTKNGFMKYGIICVIIGILIIALGFTNVFVVSKNLSRILNFGGLLIVLIALYPFHLMVSEMRDMANLKQLINILDLDNVQALKTFNKICFK